MTLRQLLEAVRAETFQTEDGEEYSVQLQPGLSDQEYREFAAQFPVPPPEEVRELLLHTRGFTFDPVEEVALTGNDGFEYADAFPHGVPLCGDGYGNFWVVDVNPESGAWAPIFYACHDPPVFAIQCATLTEFLQELFKMGRLEPNAIDRVHEEAVFEIWDRNPGLAPAPEARQSADPDVRRFAEGLPDNAHVADLREVRAGSGFSWGRHGARTDVKRDGARLLFAITPPEKQGFLQRLFGR
jgi:hypothetical protein